MAEEFRYKLIIESTATGTGAEQTVKALDAVEQASRDAAATQARSAREVVDSAQRQVIARESEQRSIFGVTDAIEKEQQAMDVLEAKRRVAARSSKINEDNSRRLGMVVNQVGFQVSDFATQVTLGGNAMTAFAVQAPQAIGALTQFGSGLKFSMSQAISLGTGIGIIATATAVASQVAVAEWGKMQNAIGKAKKSGEDYAALQVRIKELEEERRRANRLEFVNVGIQRDTEALERQVKALERINELRAAQSNTAEATAAAQVVQAEASGGNVLAARGNLLAVQTDNQIDAAAGDVAKAEASLAQAALALENANRILNEQRLRGDQFSEDFIAAEKAVDAARLEVENKQADLENQRAIFDLEKERINQNVQAELTRIGSETQQASEQATTKVAEDAIAAIRQVAEEQEGRLGPAAAGAMQNLVNLINDSIPDETQVQAITQALNLLRTSQDAQNTGIISNVDQMLASLREVAAESSRQKSEIAALRAQIAGISAANY